MTILKNDQKHVSCKLHIYDLSQKQRNKKTNKLQGNIYSAVNSSTSIFGLFFKCVLNVPLTLSFHNWLKNYIISLSYLIFTIWWSSSTFKIGFYNLPYLSPSLGFSSSSIIQIKIIFMIITI